MSFHPVEPDHITIPAAGEEIGDIDLLIPESARSRLASRSRRWQAPLVAELPVKADRSTRVARRARLPGRRRLLAIRPVCTVVRLVAAEMVFVIGGSVPPARNRRFATSHIQQIAIYVSHVVLQLTMTDIAAAYGLDRTTVGHACARVEDRRDDKAYDMLIASIERVVAGVFAKAGEVRP